jgi:hypothetical protein
MMERNGVNTPLKLQKRLYRRFFRKASMEKVNLIYPEIKVS